MCNKTKRFVTLLLVLAMAASLCAVSAFADNGYEPGSVPHTRQIDDLLVIGDSIPAGYGLFGQWDFLGRLNMSHGERVEGAYPWLVGDALQAKHVYNMARCAYRTTEVLRLIDPAFDEELAQPENTMERFISDCIFYPSGITNVNDIPTAAAEAEQEIRNADAVVINLGSNDGFTAALMAPMLKTMYYTYGMSVERALTALEGKFKNIQSIEDLVGLIMGMGIHDFLTDYNEGMATFQKYYERIIARIRQLNPTAEIYYVGMFNMFDEVKVTDFTEPGILTDFGNKQLMEIFRFVEEQSVWKDEVTYVDIKDVETHEMVTMTNPFFYLNFIVTAHPTYKGHQQCADILLDSMNLRALGHKGDIYPDIGPVDPLEGSAAPASPVAQLIAGFRDVVKGDWYADFVQYAVDRGFMKGVTSDTFAPNKTLTRAEVVTMLYALEGKPAVNGASTFSDVHDGDWYRDPVLWAASAGVTAGYEDGTFRPGQNVNRQELATMLRSYAAYKGKDLSANGSIASFADAASVADYAAEPMQWAVGHDLIHGKPGNLMDPAGESTRAEAAVMFRALDTNVLA